MLIAGTKVPVVPCLVRGTYEALPAGARWPRPKKVRITIGEPLVFEGLEDDREGWKKVAADAESAVQRLGEEPSTADPTRCPEEGS